MNNFINAYKKSTQQPSMSNTIPVSVSNSNNQESIILISESEPVDFSDNPILEENFDEAHEVAVDNMLSGNYNPTIDGRQGEQLLYGIQTVKSEQVQVDISDVRYVPKRQVNISDTQYNSDEEVKEVRKPSTKNQDGISQTEDSVSLEIDWDKTHQSRFVRWVFQQKKDQKAERGRLDIYWRRWKQERHLLEEREKELSEAEVDLANRIYQIKPLLPVAQSLKELGFDFNLANSWITCVKEMAQNRGLTLREAAWKLAEEIQDFEYLGGVKKAIEQQKQNLELLNMAAENKKEEFAALADLKKKNIGAREILEVAETIRGNNGHGPYSPQQQEDNN